MEHLLQKLPFSIRNYDEVSNTWPRIGNHILATYDNNTIILYQSVRESVALAAVSAQSFKNKLYKVEWCLRPSFLSGVFYSEWGQKKNHDHLLAITVSREGFEEMLRCAIKYTAFPEKRHKVQDARFEWGPDVDIYGSFLKRSELSLNIKGKVLESFHRYWVREVHDVTAFVSGQRRMLYENRPDLVCVPDENFYFLLDEAMSTCVKLTTESYLEDVTRPFKEADEHFLNDDVDGECEENMVCETDRRKKSEQEFEFPSFKMS